MHIDKDQTWAGLTVGNARALVRRLKWHGEFGFEKWQLDSELAALDLQEHEGVVLQRLLDDELIEESGDERWRTSRRGNALAAAHLGRRIKRKTADRLVRELLERVGQVNKGPYAYRVVRVLAFGSYLSDIATLGDVDLVVELEQRDPHRHREVADARIEAAIQGGRNFGSYVEAIAWPEQEVLRLLKNRSRYLSLHRAGELAALGCGSKSLFDIGARS